MVKTILKIEGMMCGMCESHINDAVRRAFRVKKVTSSHMKGRTVVIAEDGADPEAMRAAIAAKGYGVGEMQSVPYEKRGLFSRRK